MPAILPLIPIISSVVGLGSSVIGGINASNQNSQVLGQVNAQNAQTNALIQQLMSGIDKSAYMDNAAQAGQGALGQLAADDASRGILNSGSHQRVAAQTLSDIYTQANAKYQSDRQNAIGTAIGARQGLASAYGDQYNPNPYSGLGNSLGALGNAGATYLDYLTKKKV